MPTDWLDNLVSQVGDFKSVAPVVARVLQVVSNPKSNAQDLAEVISQDQALTARVLRVVNSAFFGLPEPVPTVQRAIVLLGFNNVKSLAVGMALASQTDAQPSGGILNPIAFWQHAVACAAAAQLLADRVGGISSEEAFTAGLLHDIGKLVFDLHFALRFRKCANWAAQQRVPLHVAEGHEFGVNHAEVGRRLGRRWNFPVQLSEAIGGHHAPLALSQPNRVRLAGVVALADLLCRVLNIPSTDWDRTLFTDKSIWDRLNLRFVDVEPMLPQLKAQLTELWRLFELPTPDSSPCSWGTIQRKRQNVLTVETQPAKGSLARLVLTGYGVSVRPVPDAPGVQHKLTRYHPQAVILDLTETAPQRSPTLQAVVRGQMKVQMANGIPVPIVILSSRQTRFVPRLPPGVRWLSSPYEPGELLRALGMK